MHSRKSLLFDEGSPWAKKDSKSLFDITMGSYDGTEICELVGLYILNTLSWKLDRKNIRLYCDDRLAVIKSTSGITADQTRKDITKIFSNLGLKITISCNLNVTNFLDMTLNLSNGKYYPYRKPNDRPVYIHKDSNHPPSIIKNLLDSISRRISDISCDIEAFNDAAPVYTNALRSSGYTHTESRPTRTRNWQLNIIWFNHHTARMSLPTSVDLSSNLSKSTFPKDLSSGKKRRQVSYVMA